MPRDGSPRLPGGAVPPAPMSIGEVADPPFAVLPDPLTVFERRSKRFEHVAAGHQIEPYLRFLSQLCAAQHRTQEGAATPPLPSQDRLATALDNTMPPISLGNVEIGGAFDEIFISLLGELGSAQLTPEAHAALESAKALDAPGRRSLVEAVLLDEIPRDEVAVHVLAAAAAQVYFAKLAAQLDVSKLKRVADGACPACGGAPLSSMIVGWDGSHGTRFCTCSICATHWNVVRIKCLVCSSDKGIAYHSLAGGAGTIMGETCESCSCYVKMLHNHKDGALDPLVDDVASLALDLTLQREGWKRASVNPFLAGY